MHITADVFEGYNSDDNDDDCFKQFVGNVKAVSDNFTYHADVATFYDKKDLVESEGHIRINGNKKNSKQQQGKSLTTQKKKLFT